MSPEWTTRAACRGWPDPQIFFPEDMAGKARERATRRAKAVCSACPVTAECLADALTYETVSSRHGIRGGLTREERKPATRRQRRVGGSDPLPREHGTTRGYRQHLKYEETICGPCRAAWSRHQAARRARAGGDDRPPLERLAEVVAQIHRDTPDVTALRRRLLEAS